MSDERLRLVNPWEIFADNVVDYAFILMDERRVVADCNIGAERMLGYRREEIIGQPADVFFVPEDRAGGSPDAEENVARRDGRAEDERWHMRRDGSRFRASGVMTPVRDASHDVIGFAKVMRDVTE